jgi:hypothetical protein
VCVAECYESERGERRGEERRESGEERRDEMRKREERRGERERREDTYKNGRVPERKFLCDFMCHDNDELFACVVNDVSFE